MKRTLSLLLSLLLCLSTALFSCTPVYEEDEIIGYWYSEEVNGALEITNKDSKAIFYSLSTGYYEYVSHEEGSYTYKDKTLTLTLSGKTYTFEYDSDMDTLYLNNEIAYKRKDAAPTVHVLYTFPDFSKIDTAALLTLGNYKALEITDAALEEARIYLFESFYEDKGFPTLTDRPAQQGDYVNIDYSGTLNGNIFQGGTASDQNISIIENSGYIPGFVEGIIGHSVGENFDVTVTFPENYGETSLAGKEVVFNMTLNSIYALDLTDENILSVAEWKEHGSYQALLNATARELAEANIDMALQGVVTLKGTLPEEAYQYFYQYYMDYYNYLASSYGMDLETVLTYMGLSKDGVLSNAKSIALSYLIPFAIAKEEGLSWTDEDYAEAYEDLVKELLSEEGNTMTEAEVRKYMDETQITYLEAELMHETVYEWLLEQNFKPAA